MAGIRAQEKSVLEKSLFVQSVSVGSSMLVPVMASCLTFIGYVSTGNNLTATQVSTPFPQAHKERERVRERE